MTDAIFYKHIRPTATAWTQARIVLWNSGGIRVSLPQGNIIFRVAGHHYHGLPGCHSNGVIFGVPRHHYHYHGGIRVSLSQGNIMGILNIN